MLYIKKQTDICLKHHTCEFVDCNIRATYGNPVDKIVRFCKKHKQGIDIDLKHKSCEFPECSARRSYGFPGYSPKTCAKHKQYGMIYNPTKCKVDELKTCAYCSTPIYITDEFCRICQVYVKTGVTIQRKEKEMSIKYLLESNGVEFTHDTVVKGGISKRRPDFIIKTKWGIIILEIDEHQHNRTTYSCQCEITRMRQIRFDFDHTVEKLLFIRYNPDKYKPLTSLVEVNDRDRKDYLIRFIKARLETIEEGFGCLGVIYLFYDGFETTSAAFELINPYEISV